MNLLLNCGVSALSWAYPPLGTALKTYGWAKTAYNVATAGLQFFSGNPIGGIATLATSGPKTCYEQAAECLNKHVFEDIPYQPSDATDKGHRAVFCWMMYGVCKALEFFKNR